jgi:hypothetical protein
MGKRSGGVDERKKSSAVLMLISGSRQRKTEDQSMDKEEAASSANWGIRGHEQDLLKRGFRFVVPDDLL